MGEYWSSSIRELRNTTLPLVAARFSPRVNGLVSTWRGLPPLLTRSSRKLLIPLAALRPPVSKARLRAAGLVARKLEGAMASISSWVASSALPFQRGSSSAAATSSLASLAVSR